MLSTACQGGTAATQEVFIEHVGIPTLAAIPQAVQALQEMDMHRKVQLVVSGGIRTGADVAKCMAMGADAVSIGTAALIALGCNHPKYDEEFKKIGSAAGYYDDYHEGKDPAGISTQDPELAARLDPVQGGRHLANFLRVLTLEAQTLARACGKSDIRNLEPEDLVALTVEAAAMAKVPWREQAGYRDKATDLDRMPRDNTMTDLNPKNEFILTMTAPAGIGIVAAVSGFLADRFYYISELSQFDDTESGILFMRLRFNAVDEGSDIERTKSEFDLVAKERKIEWSIYSHTAPMRALLMVSKYDHCLSDLLYRIKNKELNLQVTAVVSNHSDLRPMVEREGIRFVLLPVTKENKSVQEQQLLDIIKETGTELVVLARYMQILSDKVCAVLPGKVINIHHSFLPGFKGAKPYHQAFERGVKLIGATAHYVTSDLDEGPIIVQSVKEVDHTQGPAALTRIGRDTETEVLARAVSLHSEHRVFLDGNKTVVFR